MKAQQLRTVIIANADLTVVSSSLAKIRTQALTAIESGNVAEATIKDLVLLEPVPAPFFDGFRYVVFLFVTTG